MTYPDNDIFSCYRDIVGRVCESEDDFDAQYNELFQLLHSNNFLLAHSKKVTYYSILLFEEYVRSAGGNPEDRGSVFVSALFHDIGKLKVPEYILNKPSGLEESEFLEIKKHPGYSILFLDQYPVFKGFFPNILHHHERFDGTGYPDNLSGNKIPVISRIIAVADTFDAILSDRPYQSAKSVDYALGELLENTGSQFDPLAVDCFLNLYKANKIALGWTF